MISPHNSIYPDAVYPQSPYGNPELYGMMSPPRNSLGGILPSDFSSGILPRSGWFHYMPPSYSRQFSLPRSSSESDMLKGRHLGKQCDFSAIVDVHQFKPEDITVKTVDNYVVVEGNHEERDDGHGSVQRHFVRKYQLPKEFDKESVHSTLSSDGILIIKASPTQSIAGGGEKQIQILHTNAPAHLHEKHNDKNDVFKKMHVGMKNGN